MTEQGWETSEDPQAMLGVLLHGCAELQRLGRYTPGEHTGLYSDRKLRLWVEAVTGINVWANLGDDFSWGEFAWEVACSRDPPAHVKATLLRCVFGNPWRPVLDNMLGATARQRGLVFDMARSAYEGREWGALPVLADVLEEAGSNDGRLLAHLRSTGPHCRGCWVLDVILGKR